MEESKKRKHSRAGNMSRHVEENFSRKSSNKIRDKPRFTKGLFHHGSQVHAKVAMIVILSLEL